MRRFNNLIFFILVSLTVTGCGTTQQKEARYLKRGNALFAQGRFEKASLEFKNAIRLRPADPEAYYRLGLVDEAEQNISAAYSDFSIAAQQDAHYQPALLKIANYNLAAGELDQAQKLVDTVLADAPDQPEAHALNAALLLRQKDYAVAEKEARFALERDPANVTAFSVLTGLYLAEGDMEKAGATVDDGVDKNPGNLPLLLLKADIYQQAGNLPKVDEAYRAIFALRPDEMQFRLDLATLYANAGDLDDAESILRNAVTFKPDDWQMKHALVTFLVSKRDATAAEKEIDTYIKAYPGDDNPVFWLVELYLRQNKVDQAALLLEQVVSENRSADSEVKARAILARVDLARNDKAAAEKLVDDLLAKDPDNVEALFVRASLAFDRGQYESTIADLRNIISTKPQDMEAYRLLAETLQRQGHPDLAMDTLRQLEDISPDNQQPYLDRATVDIREHAAGQALAELKKAADVAPSDTRAGMMRADILTQLGRTQEAIDLYDNILKRNPQQNIAANNMAALIATYAYSDPVQLEKAAKAIERFSHTNEPAVLDTVAWVNYRENKIPTALAAMQKIALGKNGADLMSPEMHYHYGAILLKAGKPDSAKIQLQQAIVPEAAYPDLEQAKQLLATLD